MELCFKCLCCWRVLRLACRTTSAKLWCWKYFIYCCVHGRVVSVLSFYLCVGLGDQTQVVRLVMWALPPLSHLTSQRQKWPLFATEEIRPAVHDCVTLSQTHSRLDLKMPRLFPSTSPNLASVLQGQWVTSMSAFLALSKWLACICSLRVKTILWTDSMSPLQKWGDCKKGDSPGSHGDRVAWWQGHMSRWPKNSPVESVSVAKLLCSMSDSQTAT